MYRFRLAREDGKKAGSQRVENRLLLDIIEGSRASLHIRDKQSLHALFRQIRLNSTLQAV